MGTPRLQKLLVVIAALSVVGGLGALWWWALFGMSTDVATACYLTWAVVFIGSVGWATFPGAFDDD